MKVLTVNCPVSIWDKTWLNDTAPVMEAGDHLRQLTAIITTHGLTDSLEFSHILLEDLKNIDWAFII